jgi:hypothetical protein
MNTSGKEKKMNGETEVNVSQQPLELLSGDAIQCTIDNQTTGAIQYNQSSTTGGSLDIQTNTVNSGSSATVFSAQGPSMWPSGCGGQVVYNLPNGVDQLVIVYNVSVTGQSAQIFAELQNQNGQAPGTDAYFVVVTNGSVNGTSLSPTVTVYSAAASATPQTGNVQNSSVHISVYNQLDTWITINNFPNPTWDILPICTNATSSIAPGQTAVVLASAEAYKFTLIYNITNEYLLTINQNQQNTPTAGFNTSCPYAAAVSGGQASNGYAYTVTVSSLSELVSDARRSREE